MSDVTALSAVQDNWKLSRELDLVTEQYGDSEKRFFKAEHEYVIEKAKAWLRSTGTVAEREYIATVETDALRERAKGAEADVRLCRQRLATLRARMENGRSGVSVLKLERELDR